MSALVADLAVQLDALEDRVRTAGQIDAITLNILIYKLQLCVPPELERRDRHLQLPHEHRHDVVNPRVDVHGRHL